MSRERKAMIKEMTNLIEDIMDNYEKYSSSEKQEIDSMISRMGELNDKLKPYDKKTPSKSKFITAFQNFFGKKK